ncbi:PhzF family phenazine biosynthesis protein [Psychromarinibacter sp. C21-152]|uniref:PhzF family phenazine biosynthesis protein n=1 Tax=Psychromarinibacter sediminicola TaxID=3033385 RepID=A0AAE3NUM9_9RHOB|nr:PhzF family phenazine biosynthesis protein [Psychromarinibacter sediminicola]MDF0602326.1 PhzF family phenazine biosynthesis protein [Psychromarinibacter sediminicola]
MLDLVTYDVFTETPFRGNPLAIVPRADGLGTDQMQTIARELNLSETIFVLPPDDPAHRARVRIFFPTAEIPFAGHPTVGCAIHLSGLAAAEGDATVDMTLEEVAGPVPVRVRKAGGRLSAEFVAPQLPTLSRKMEDAGLAARALGIGQDAIGNAVAPLPEVWQAGPSYIVLPVASVEALGRAGPAGHDWQAFTDRAGCFSAWLFAQDGEGGFRARMFSPAGGTPEDPATGSAVVTFAGLFAARGHCPPGETALRITQGVEMGRRSEIDAVLVTDATGLTQVRIAGAAVPVSEGRIRRP